mmetsp:Transcript_42690/g.93527  ORF Transcript_42690/g.93527 Transcript_42690/m.93527 type:complete len:272 (+) Transcript_42690:256-1071(+)
MNLKRPRRSRASPRASARPLFPCVFCECACQGARLHAYARARAPMLARRVSEHCAPSRSWSHVWSETRAGSRVYGESGRTRARETDARPKHVRDAVAARSHARTRPADAVYSSSCASAALFPSSALLLLSAAPASESASESVELVESVALAASPSAEAFVAVALDFLGLTGLGLGFLMSLRISFSMASSLAVTSDERKAGSAVSSVLACAVSDVLSHSVKLAQRPDTVSRSSAVISGRSAAHVSSIVSVQLTASRALETTFGRASSSLARR